MKNIIALLTFVFIINTGLAQKYKSYEGTITFFSEAPLENIDAENKDVASVFDTENGNIVFSVPIKSFNFDRSLMQEHFNEKYMESEKYPKAIFKGNIKGYDRSKSGPQNVTASGDMTIHGVTRHITAEGSLTNSGNQITISAEFTVKVADYEVDIPKVLWQNIAEEVEVKVNLSYKPI